MKFGSQEPKWFFNHLQTHRSFAGNDFIIRQQRITVPNRYHQFNSSFDVICFQISAEGVEISVCVGTER